MHSAGTRVLLRWPTLLRSCCNGQKCGPVSRKVTVGLGFEGAFCEPDVSEVESLDLPEAQQGARHEGIPEQLVPSHMRLLASYP